MLKRESKKEARTSSAHVFWIIRKLSRAIEGGRPSFGSGRPSFARKVLEHSRLTLESDGNLEDIRHATILGSFIEIFLELLHTMIFQLNHFIFPL